MTQYDDKIKDVISFYGDKDNYKEKIVIGREIVSKIEIDNGSLARELLKELTDIEEEKSGKLYGMTAFLSGGIDRCDDDGVGWRRDLRMKCKRKKLPLSFFDPTDKPKILGSEIGDEKSRIKKLMRKGKWKQTQNEVKTFRRYDLRMVDHSHLYIIYIDLSIHYCGTWDEFNVAERQNKPIFVIMAPGYSKYDIPSWAVASVNEDEVFEGVDECVEHLKLLNEGKMFFDKRWVKI